MKKINSIIFLVFITCISCTEEETKDPNPTDFTVVFSDGTTTATFGSLPYRVYYPKELTGQTFVIHVSRGGNGNGDDRGQLLPYVDKFVQEGYVVVQIDHRNAGADVNLIAQYRGEEIKFISSKVADGTLDYGDFSGTIDGTKQGFLGHSGGCMEGLQAAGTQMTHGNYFVPQIKAVYGISPAGYTPDQFGITSSGYSGISTTAIFVAIGEEEKDVNGGGDFMATDWRLQAYPSMTTSGVRYQAFIKGQSTAHTDIHLDNPYLKNFNVDNSEAFFDTYIKGDNRQSEIGKMTLPPNNEVVLTVKGD